MLALSDVQKFYDFKEQHKQISGKVYIGCELIAGLNINIQSLQLICKEIMLIHKQLYIQVNNNHQVYLMDIEKLDFDDFVIISDIDTDINDYSIVKYLLEEPPNNGKQNLPLWRLVYFEKMNYLVFNFGHCFYDGISGVNFLKLVLDKLSNIPLTNTNYGDFEPHVSDKKLLDYGIVDLYPRPTYNLFDKFNIIKSEIYEGIVEPLVMKSINLCPKLLEFDYFKKFNRLYDPDVLPAKGKYIDSYHSIKISFMSTKKLIKISKLLNTTLNTLLLTLLCISSPKVNKHYANTSKFNIPINMRPLIFQDGLHEIGSNLIALAISSTQITTPLINIDDILIDDHIDIFQLRMIINELHPLVKQSIAESTSMETYSIASYYRNDLTKLLTDKPYIDFELSNLGLFKHPLIKDVIFNQGLEPMNYMNISAIGGVNGTNINFMWYHSVNDYSKQRVMTFEKMINILCKQEIDDI